jgi:hypothetical protein
MLGTVPYGNWLAKLHRELQPKGSAGSSQCMIREEQALCCLPHISLVAASLGKFEAYFTGKWVRKFSIRE